MRNINVMTEYLKEKEVKRIYGNSKNTLHLLSDIKAVKTKYTL